MLDAPEQARLRGANAVFLKPYSPARVREKLEQLLSDETHTRLSILRGVSHIILSAAAVTALAQNTPEMREVLSRLERLEKDNEALTEEIRALRQELAGFRAPGRGRRPRRTHRLTEPRPQAERADQPTADETASHQRDPHRRTRSNQSGILPKISDPAHRHGIIQRIRERPAQRRHENPPVASLGTGR